VEPLVALEVFSERLAIGINRESFLATWAFEDQCGRAKGPICEAIIHSIAAAYPNVRSVDHDPSRSEVRWQLLRVQVAFVLG
jgi:hypothetical protein